MKKLKRYWSLPMSLRNMINKYGAGRTLEVFAKLEVELIEMGNEEMAIRSAKTQREIREAIEWPLPTDTIH